MHCVNHPGTEAQSFCQNCGKALCSSCVRTTANGQILCEPCMVTTGGNPTQAYWQSFVTAPPGSPNPAAAAVLGLIPGVGAMYNGQLFKGLIHVVIFAVLVSITDHYGVFGILIGAWVLYQSFEAFQTAKARRDGLPLPDPFGLNELGNWLNLGGANRGFGMHHGSQQAPPQGSQPTAAGPRANAGTNPDPNPDPNSDLNTGQNAGANFGSGDPNASAAGQTGWSQAVPPPYASPYMGEAGYGYAPPDYSQAGYAAPPPFTDPYAGPVTGQVQDPYAGAYQPGVYPPGSYPPGSYPPGAYPPGAYPQGPYAPGSYPPGSYPPGSVPPVAPGPYGGRFGRGREPVWAFILIGLGLMFLLQSMGIISHAVRYTWPLLLIGFGVWMIIRRVGYTQGGSK